MYLVYKITNIINNKTYIGVHKTDNINDSYMGSGIAIKNAIKKHGIENFIREVLFVTEDKDEAYLIEKNLTEDYHLSSNYNMKLGGVGGFTKENSKKGLIARSRLGGLASRDKKKGLHSLSKDQIKENGRKGGLKNKGKKRGPLSEEIKEKMRATRALNKSLSSGRTIG